MKEIKIIIILSFIVLIVQPLQGQNLRRHKKDHLPCHGTECQALADQLFNLKLHYQSIKYYQEVLKEAADNQKSLLRVGQAYQESNMYEEALHFYQQLIALESQQFPEAYYGAGLMAQALGDLTAATQYFSSFLVRRGSNDKMKEHARLQIRSIKALANVSPSQTDIKAEKLGNEITKLQYAAFPAGNDTFIHVTSALQTRKKVKDYQDFSGKYDTLYVNRLAEAAGSESKLLDIPLPDDEFHTGSACLSHDGQKLYFTMFSSFSLDNFCHIYQTTRNKKGQWSTPEKLSENINLAGFSSKDPMIIRDPIQGDVLFFSSDKPGGKGGYDLYYAIKNEDGVFSQVVNLGEPTNTAFDEVSPFFDQNSKNLYFSSNGHLGFGHYDVYLMLFDFGQKKGHLYNMGYPVNSTANDYYFSLAPDAKNGFVTTDHRSAKNADGQLHLQKLSFKAIFSYNTLPENAFEVETFDQDDSESNLFNQAFAYQNIPASAIDVTQEQATDININGQLLSKDEPVAGITVQLCNQAGEVVDTLSSDEQGYFNFRNLPDDEFYSLLIDSEEAGMSASMVYSNHSGDTIKLFNSNNHRQYFQFKQLADNLNNEVLVQNDDVSMFGEVLREGEIVVGELIFLTDKNGNVLDSTETNQQGKFTFRHLSEDEQYLVKLLTEEQGMMVKLAFKDEEGNVLETLNSNENEQFFTFNKLSHQESRLAQSQTEDISISGEILGQHPRKQMVLLVDEEGNIIKSTTSDEYGNFEFRNLPAGEEYTVWLNENDQGMTVVLNFKNEENEIIRTLNSDKDKEYFDFKNLANYTSALSMMASNDNSSFKLAAKNEEQAFIKDLKQAMSYRYYESLEKKYGQKLHDEFNLRVQIGAYSKHQPGLFEHLKEAGQVESREEDGLTKYLMGNFDALASAEVMRRSAVEQGIKDAFIAVYQAEKRVAILIY